MSKGSALFLVVLSFITGFFVCDLINSIVDDMETYFPQEYIKTDGQQDNQSQVSTMENIDLEVLKIVNPAKAIRNSNFELLVYLKDKLYQQREYYIWVALQEVNGDKRIVADKLKLADLPNARDKEVVRLGPFKVNVPPEADLGRYYIGIGVVKNPNIPNVPFKLFKENIIEIVSLN